MAIELRRKFQGLVTDIAETAAAETALLVADNVTLRKVGALEARPGYFFMESMQRTYVQSIAYRGKRVYLTADGNAYLGVAAGNQQLCTLNSPIASIISFAPLRVDTLRMKEARNNLYIATAQGVNKITSPTSATMLLAGNPITFEVNAYVEVRTHINPILQPNQRVAYRVVSVSKDENGVVVRSRPSGWSICNNNSGQPANPTVNVQATFSAVPFTAIEVYRTRIFPQTVVPDDEMQLVRSIPVSAFTTSTGGGFTSYGYYFDDTVTDEQRGVTLYTSPSRGGMENASDRPPGCACIERFRGHVFFANTTGPARRIYSFNQISRPPFTGTATSGSTVVTAVTPSPLGLVKVGHLLGFTAGFPSGLPGGSIYATDVTASTITVSVAAIATTSTTIIANDRIGYKVGTAESWFQPFDPSFLPSRGITSYGVSPAMPGYSYTFVIESIARGGAPIQMRATNGATYNPPLPEWTEPYDAGEPVERLPNGIMWSEPDEPEHCPLKNSARVGDSGRAILGLTATRDALYILKEDGVYRLTGSSAVYFRIDPVDPVTLCVLPTSVQVLADSLVFLSNRGLVAITGTAVNVVSEAIQSELAPIIDTIRENQLTSGVYLMPGIDGTAACRDEARQEYHLSLGSRQPSFGGHLLVWFVRAGGFTTYTFLTQPVCLSDGASGKPVVLSTIDQVEPLSWPTPLSIRIAPHGFVSPETQQKHWTHITAGVHHATVLTSLVARVSSSGPSAEDVYTDEPFDLKSVSDFPGGGLFRTLVPRAHQRAWIVRVELRIDIANGFFQLEHVGMESIAAVPNRNDMRSTGSS